MHELLIAARDFFDGGEAGNLVRTPAHQWIPEARAADSETNESWYGRGGREPKLDLAVVLSTPENDAADLVPAICACGGHNLFTVLPGVEPFDFPDVRLHSSCLQFLDPLHHQEGTELQVKGPLVSTNPIQLRFFGRNQQLKHETARTLHTVKIVR